MDMDIDVNFGSMTAFSNWVKDLKEFIGAYHGPDKVNIKVQINRK